MLERAHSLLIIRQCALLALPRSSIYHVSDAVTDDDMDAMRQIDQCHLKPPTMAAGVFVFCVDALQDAIDTTGYRGSSTSSRAVSSPARNL